MINLDYLLNLIEHISFVIQTELKTANLFHIFYIGVIEFAVFYFFSKFAKNIILKTFILSFALYTLWGSVQDDTILTEPLIFATFGLIAPHLNIFSLWIRYIQKLFFALKELFTSFIDYILTPFVWLKEIFEKLSLFFRKKEDVKQENYDQEKTYKDYFNENKEKQKEYERQKSDYFKNKQDKNSSHNKKQSEQKQEKKQQQQKKKYQKTDQENNYQQKTYSRWDSTNPYEVLGISKNANPKEIKKAFRNLAKKYHPDLTQDKKDEHKIIFQKINNAYKKLIK
jgi:hypothetical protein